MRSLTILFTNFAGRGLSCGAPVATGIAGVAKTHASGEGLRNAVGQSSTWS